MIHKYKIALDDNIFLYLPQDITLPSESDKYWQGDWIKSYVIMLSAYQIYGDVDMYWLILKANNLDNIWGLKSGDKFRILLPDFLNEIIYD